MAVEIDQQGAVRIIKMAGQASTQSFSMAFLPEIAAAIDKGLKDNATKAIVLTGTVGSFRPVQTSMLFRNRLKATRLRN